MKYELTREQLEEIVQGIVTNHLDVDEAMEYALSVCSAFTCDDAEVVWPEKSGDNMEFTHLTGEAVKAGVYES
nr:hypothetical protein [Alteromonas macleodii]